MLRKISFVISILLVSFVNNGLRAQITDNDFKLLKKISVLRGELTLVRRMEFENITINNQMKAAGIIDEILNRAEQKVLGTIPKGRFPWCWGGYEDQQGMVATAEEYINTFASGKDPFEGKYAEPGGHTVDHAFIEKDGVVHVFYIRGTAAGDWPEYPLFNFGHATTTDLINWTIEKPVLQCPESGVDEYQVWAPYVLKHENKYWMFYTGVNDSVCQSICIATSDDLYNWERYEANPVITTESWGNWGEEAWSDCRDPNILKDGDTFYCYYTAGLMIPGTDEYEYRLGISSSKDLINWKYEGNVRLEHSLKTPPESPFAVKRNGKYYVFYTSYKYGTTYIVSDDPVSGWIELSKEEAGVISGVSASEILQKDGKWYISVISHMKNGLHFLEIRDLTWNKDGSIIIGKTLK
ncbi:MAG: family 43 glycosylhydrolase [Ignavibacteria bacterium]|jgi:beta-fructofuranosidase